MRALNRFNRKAVFHSLKVSLAATAVSLFLCTSCSKAKNSKSISGDSEPAKVESFQKNMPFAFGAAVNINLLKSNTSYRELVIKEYSSLTAENAMKFGALHPAEKTYNWSDADYLVQFASDNNKRVHGHTLIWYKSLPTWVMDFQGDSEAWEQLFKNHIQAVVSRFRGRVVSWDVVNEALEDNGTLRNSIWLQKLGPNYIARAFQYAHEADPNALLFYNDYGHEYSSVKRAAIINLVNGLKNAGVPIHGIGLQMHTRYNQTDANLNAAITDASQTGLKVHISELDIAVNPDNNPSLTFSALLEEQQAEKYFFIVKTFNALPANQKFGITTWNVSDADTWITGHYKRPDWPLPFDKNYKRKACYQAIIDAVK